MTDCELHLPNTRSPGTPVCHPNDTYEPTASEAFSITHRSQPSEYVELHASSAFTLGDLIGDCMRSRLAEMCVRVGMTRVDFRWSVKKARFG